jgi:hypothetical protein
MTTQDQEEIMSTNRSTRLTKRGLAKLGVSTESRLLSYTLAATAAGVALLALTEHAQAEIIYTPAQSPTPLWGLI